MLSPLPSCPVTSARLTPAAVRARGLGGRRPAPPARCGPRRRCDESRPAPRRGGGYLSREVSAPCRPGTSGEEVGTGRAARHVLHRHRARDPAPVDSSVDEWFEQLRRAAGDTQVAEPDVDAAERSGRKPGCRCDGWQRLDEDADTAAPVHEVERAIDLLDRYDHGQQHSSAPRATASSTSPAVHGPWALMRQSTRPAVAWRTLLRSAGVARLMCVSWPRWRRAMPRSSQSTTTPATPAATTSRTYPGETEKSKSCTTAA